MCSLILCLQAMYAQMVYKDRKILEMNNKVLEMDRRVMDLQELAGEKQEVIRGRDRVIEVSQICSLLSFVFLLVCLLHIIISFVFLLVCLLHIIIIIDMFDFQGCNCEMHLEML